MRFKASGFTIIEMLIGITLLAILLALGLPSFTQLLANSRVRAQAESMLSGIQFARSEAIKRNSTVVFALVDGNPSAIGGTSAPQYCGSNQGDHWAVFAETTVAGATTYELLDSRVNHEGAHIDGQAGNWATAHLSNTPGATAPGRIAFSSMGTARLDSTASIAISGFSGATCAHAGGTLRCLRIEVSPAGSARMCDPSITAAGDGRRCTTP